MGRLIARGRYSSNGDALTRGPDWGFPSVGRALVLGVCIALFTCVRAVVGLREAVRNVLVRLLPELFLCVFVSGD